MSLEIKYRSGIHTLKNVQMLGGSLDDIWEFFTDPKNLNKITLPEMKFRITSENLPEKIYPGQIISYDLKIFPFRRDSWITEITHIREKLFFVDKQRFGPYKMWHHEHHFEEVSPSKIKMTDLVSYKLPAGRPGNMVAGKMVAGKLRKIFEYREKFCSMKFPE